MEIVSFLLPHLVTAGRYAHGIQRRINAQPSKGGDTAFHQALTDADLSVQAFLEVAMLSRFPEVAFYSEEQAVSLNAKYFPPQAEIEMLVDPIDGTRAYLDGAATYQIIVTLRESNRVTAVLCHMPTRERCYIGAAGLKSLACSPREMEAGLVTGTPVQLSDQSRRVLLFNAPEVRRALGEHFEVLDIFEEYTKRAVHHGFTEMLAGTAAACIHPRPQLIDAGAISFIAQQAGGILSDFRGEPLRFDHPADQRGPGLVVSASQKVHDEILARLAERP